MFTRQETQIGFTLNSKILQYYKILIILANYMHLFVLVSIIFRVFLSVFLIIIFVTGRKWEAGVALVEVSDALKLLLEVGLSTVVLQVLNQLMDDAT